MAAGTFLHRTRADGVAPHDLALDADLRWRDFDSYQRVFRKLREHSLAMVRSTTGRVHARRRPVTSCTGRT
ncbi:MAG: hypothetical protein ABW022_01895 [Actinoplanes sp.]